MDTEQIRKNLKEFGIYLKKIRNAQGLSTAKLAELSGVNGSLINKLENNKANSYPKNTTLEKLAHALKVDFEELQNQIKINLDLPKKYKDYIDLRKEKIGMIRNHLTAIGIEPSGIDEVIKFIEIVQVKQYCKKNNNEEIEWVNPLTIRGLLKKTD